MILGLKRYYQFQVTRANLKSQILNVSLLSCASELPLSITRRAACAVDFRQNTLQRYGCKALMQGNSIFFLSFPSFALAFLLISELLSLVK